MHHKVGGFLFKRLSEYCRFVRRDMNRGATTKNNEDRICSSAVGTFICFLLLVHSSVAGVNEMSVSNQL
jgi:hypothetical protein